MDPPVHFWQKKMDRGSTFFCQKWTCLAKSGPGPFCQEKSGPGPVLAGEKSGPGPVSPSKSKQVHFWQGKKVDPVQFRCQVLSRSIFGRGKKWTRSSFAVKIQAGPFLAGEKSGPGPVSLSKSRQVHFWQGKKVDPVQFPAEIQAGPFLAGEKSGPGPVSCRNPGRSIFGRGKKWTRSSFLPKSRQVHFWQGKKVDPVQFPAEIQAGPFLAGEKSGPGPVSCRNHGRSIFGRGKKWTRSSFLPKSRQVHFWQGKKVDQVQFPAEIQAGPFLAGEKSGPGPVSCRNPGRSNFGRGKKWTRSSFLPKSRQVQFWQGKKVDPVQFPAEIQAGPFLAGEKSGPGPVSCRNPGRSIFGRGKKWTRSSFLPKSRQVHFWQGKKVDPVQFRC